MLRKVLLYIVFAFSIFSISGAGFAASLSSEKNTNTLSNHIEKYNAKKMEKQKIEGKEMAKGENFKCSNEHIGNVASCISEQYDEIFNLFLALPFIMGSWFGVKAAISLKDHNENPQQTPLKRPLMYLAISGCMLSLPEFAGQTVNTFFDTGKTRAYPISLSDQN